MKKSGFTAKDIIANRRVRLAGCLFIALITFLLSRNRATAIISFMYVWIAFAFSYLFFSWTIILSYHPIEVRTIANKEDWGGTVIFLFILLSSFVSLFAIVFLLRSIPDESKRGLSFHILLAIASVFCSWTLIHTLFTLKYAHKYYGMGEPNDGDAEGTRGLEFPNEKEPDFLDFAYYSFVVGMTFQVSDVQITSREVRRLTLMHGFLAFIYNTFIVALSINIISGMIAK